MSDVIIPDRRRSCPPRVGSAPLAEDDPEIAHEDGWVVGCELGVT